MSIFAVSLILGGLLALYLYFRWTYTYWERRGVPTVPGAIPLAGHLLPIITLRTNLREVVHAWYNQFKNSSMVGFYDGMLPGLMVREPDLVKSVLQTSFSSFHENGIKIDAELDPLSAKNPFFTYGEEWQTGRKRLTYAFSSMRLKILSEAVRSVCKKFDDYLERQLPSGERKAFEMKDLFSKFTGEVVANAGFGIEGKCFEDKTDPESFHEIGRKIFETSPTEGMLQAIVFVFPILNKFLKLRFVPKDVDHFFRTIVKQVLEARRNDSTKRNDFLQLMVDLEKSSNEKFDDETLVSQAFSFFLDGYETSAATISYVIFELSRSPEIQEKLRQDVLRVLAKHNDEITYEALKDMTYLDQVISESQRLNNPLSQMVKRCTNTCELKGSDGVVCRVEPGTKIIIPVYDLQRDPEHWEKSEIFDPDRWSEDRKNSLNKYTFLAFGEGPRICVGMRMALLQSKAAIVTLLRKYKIERNPKTSYPLQIKLQGIIAMPESGLWTYLKRL